MPSHSDPSENRSKELENPKAVSTALPHLSPKTITWEQAAYMYSSDKTRNNGGLVTSQKPVPPNF